MIINNKNNNNNNNNKNNTTTTIVQFYLCSSHYYFEKGNGVGRWNVLEGVFGFFNCGGVVVVCFVLFVFWGGGGWGWGWRWNANGKLELIPNQFVGVGVSNFLMHVCLGHTL